MKIDLNSLPELHQAVLTHDIAAVKRLANAKTTAMRDSMGFTPLELARYLGYDLLIPFLLDKRVKRRIVVKIKGNKKLVSINADQFFNEFGVTYRSSLKFGSYEEFKKVIQNCPWTLSSSFLGAENRDYAMQYQNELDHAKHADISIRWVDEDIGYGVFANDDISEGTYIIEFTGEVRQLSRRKPTHNIYCFHYPTRFWSWNYYAIDALNEGNEARFINHSDNPNLQPLCICDRRLLHIAFVAKKPIKADEQLTYNYGKDFWEKRTKLDLEKTD